MSATRIDLSGIDFAGDPVTGEAVRDRLAALTDGTLTLNPAPPPPKVMPFECRVHRKARVVYRGLILWDPATGNGRTVGVLRRVDLDALRRMHVEYSRRLRARRRRNR